MRVIVLVLLTALAACGGGAGGGGDGADAGTGACNGCFENGQCVAGTAMLACGRGGEVCRACGDGTSCEDSQCLAPSACDATTCPDGCCDDDDVCQSGTTTDDCGTNGERCASCSGGQCDQGSCAYQCNELTCGGCCDGDACIETPTNNQCGASGQACTSCGSGTACIGGQCVDASCAATCNGCCVGQTCYPDGATNASHCGTEGKACQTCGSSFTCNNGCEPDDSLRWNLTIVSGTMAATTFDGSAWDPFGGLPDPLLCMENNTGATTAVCTPYMSNTTMPIWNFQIETGVHWYEIGDRFWRLYDDDYGFDDVSSSCLWRDNVDLSIYDGNVHTFNCTMSTASVNGYSEPWSVRFKVTHN